MQYLLYGWIILIAGTAYSADPSDASANRDALKKQVTITNDYVHDWLPFPPVRGRSVFENREMTYKPRAGRAMAVWTLSVSSVRSQNILPEVMRMQQKYERLFTDFVYVFVNDLPHNVRNFAAEWKLEGRVILGEDDFKKAFKYRQPPTVYIADRHGWLNWMSYELTNERLQEIDDYLQKLNVL